MTRSKGSPHKRHDVFVQWKETDTRLFDSVIEEESIEKPKVLQNRRKRNNNNVVQEIQRLRNTTNLIIPKTSFSALIHQIMKDLRIGNHRIEADAIIALQEASESHLCMLFQALKQCATHAGRATVAPKDLHFFKCLMDLVQAPGFS